MQVGYLASYEHMGRAQLECEGTCTCQSSVLDGHYTRERVSITLMHDLLVGRFFGGFAIVNCCRYCWFLLSLHFVRRSKSERLLEPGAAHHRGDIGTRQLEQQQSRSLCSQPGAWGHPGLATARQHEHALLHFIPPFHGRHTLRPGLSLSPLFFQATQSADCHLRVTVLNETSNGAGEHKVKITALVAISPFAFGFMQPDRLVHHVPCGPCVAASLPLHLLAG